MIKWILISIPIILGLCVFIESFSEFSKKCDEILKVRVNLTDIKFYKKYKRSKILWNKYCKTGKSHYFDKYVEKYDDCEPEYYSVLSKHRITDEEADKICCRVFAANKAECEFALKEYYKRKRKGLV